MKVNSIVSALLLLVGANASNVSPLSLGDCKLLCKDLRPDVLADKQACKGALQQPPKLHNVCVEGRKKAFNQSCISLCTGVELSLTSFTGCQMALKKGGRKSFDWCRKGYDSILQSLEPLLVEQAEKAKLENENEVQVEDLNEAQVESEPVSAKAEEPVVDPEESKSVETKPKVNESTENAIEDKPVHIEPEAAHEGSSDVNSSEANSKNQSISPGKLRGAVDDRAGDETQQEDISVMSTQVDEDGASDEEAREPEL